jgi:hypothetical protein
MSIRTCDHLKEDGVYCDSAALTGKNFCYFHLNVRGRRLKLARALARDEASGILLPVIAAAAPASASSPNRHDAVNEEVA